MAPVFSLARFGFVLAFLAAAVPSRAQTEASDLPADLPTHIDLPNQVIVTVQPQSKVSRPKPQTQRDVEAEQQRLVYSPDLVKASYTRVGNEVQAFFEWEGGTRSQAFQVGPVTVRQTSLRYPEMLSTINDIAAMDFELNSPIYDVAARPGAFPGVGWYRPDLFVKEDSLGSRRVYVFQAKQGGSATVEAMRQRAYVPTLDMSAPSSPSEKSNQAQGPRLYLDKQTKLPLALETGAITYRFAYAQSPATSLTPTGAFVDPVQKLRTQRAKTP